MKHDRTILTVFDQLLLSIFFLDSLIISSIEIGAIIYSATRPLLYTYI